MQEVPVAEAGNAATTDKDAVLHVPVAYLVEEEELE